MNATRLIATRSVATRQSRRSLAAARVVSEVAFRAAARTTRRAASRSASLAVSGTLGLLLAGTLEAQAIAPPTSAAPSTALRARSAAPTAAAWSLPDPDVLIERVLKRIVEQDKPNAIPVRDYTQRLIGREETMAAVRQFSGSSVQLRATAFSAVDGWSDTRRSEYRPCIGAECAAPVNSLWLAVTRIERGELPHELHVWYTTSFASDGPTGPATHTYQFCERWLRVGGQWKYDGFVRVNAG